MTAMGAFALCDFFSDCASLKICLGSDVAESCAEIESRCRARTLPSADKGSIGPVLGLQVVVASVLGQGWCTWPAVVQHFLGLRNSSEEARSNWARRPEEEEENDLSGRFRPSQLHNILVEVWTQTPLLHALCALWKSAAAHSREICGEGCEGGCAARERQGSERSTPTPSRGCADLHP